MKSTIQMVKQPIRHSVLSNWSLNTWPFSIVITKIVQCTICFAIFRVIIIIELI